ncbi:hypothetical protein LQZ18_01600 [Lachnospiraceae bacterium ZAX-1]
MAQNNAISSEAWGKVSRVIGKKVAATLEGIEREVARRAYRASNELRNASLLVLRGDGTGKVYRVPGTKAYYTASAPGESPAVRNGTFRASWGAHIHVEKQGKQFQAMSAIESNLKAGSRPLGEILENGSRKMKPRPYKQKVIDMALPKIKSIYNSPYKGV